MGVFAALQFLPVSAAQDKVRIQGRPAAVGLKIEDQGFPAWALNRKKSDSVLALITPERAAGKE